jgi:hypothetical protein
MARQALQQHAIQSANHKLVPWIRCEKLLPYTPTAVATALYIMDGTLWQDGVPYWLYARRRARCMQG